MKITALTIALVAACASANPFTPRTHQDAEAAYVDAIVRNARRLDGQNNQYYPDLSKYSIQFQKCQFMKQYASECNDNLNTCLETKRFAIFRLCSSCSSCNYNYGEYMVDLDTYIQATTDYYSAQQTASCQACSNSCQTDDASANANVATDDGDDNIEGEPVQDDAVANDANNGGRQLSSSPDCSTCVSECAKISAMESNGYVDAINYVQCQQIYSDGNGVNYYAGSMCASDGSKVKIGVFKDDQCTVPTSLDAEDYLTDGNGNSVKLSHFILKKVYTNSCISCVVDQTDDQSQAQSADICGTLYDASAKCESTHGFDSNADYSSNQQQQESTICTMISQLASGTFDQTGEIVLSGKGNSVSSSSSSPGQKFALSVFMLSSIGLAVYSAVLHQKLTKGGTSLSMQENGAMA